MFTTLIVKPLFNILALIYAILPWHNFGLALIVFTILIRLAMWPLVKKQLHQAKAMRKLQPELKKIKAATKGDKQKETQMTMELYKEKGINPLATLPIFAIQFIILIGLNSGIRKIIANPASIVTFAYKPIQHIHWMQHVAGNIHAFDDSLLSFVNLSKSALGAHGIYWPAMIIVLASALSQYFQSKQLMPTSADSKSLRQIMRSAGSGKQADQSEVNAAVGRSTRYLLPIMIFFFTVSLASALSLYWLTSGVVAYIQQSIALREDEEELEAIADEPTKDVKKIPEAEVVEKAEKTKATTTAINKTKPKNKKKTKTTKRKKR
ncbi:MAG TPA: YidC/Oxa1 family membrane protein insertase [Candidatus Saccharimonadales bacterium]